MTGKKRPPANRAETVINNKDFVSCEDMSVRDVMREQVDILRRRNHMMKQQCPQAPFENSILANAVAIINITLKALTKETLSGKPFRKLIKKEVRK